MGQINQCWFQSYVDSSIRYIYGNKTVLSWVVFELIYISNENCVTIDSTKCVPVHITDALILKCYLVIDINILLCLVLLHDMLLICCVLTCWGCTYIYFRIIALTTRPSYHFHTPVEEPRTIQLVYNQNTKDGNLLPWYWHTSSHLLDTRREIGITKTCRQLGQCVPSWLLLVWFKDPALIVLLYVISVSVLF